MRKWLFSIAFAIVSLPAFAGLTYNFQSVTTGMRQTTLSGTVAAEGGNLRVNVTSGDGLLFKNNSFAVSKSGGLFVSVADPESKSYYDLEVEQLLGNTGSMLKQFGANISIQNPKVIVNDAGDGGEIEGYPTRHQILDGSYDMAVDVMGQKMTMHLTMKTESWLTNRIGSEYVNFLQQRGIRTGVEAFDKLLDSYGEAMKGFPLKLITTVHVSQNQNAIEMTSTTTTTVTGITKKTIAASEFEIPPGYAKTDSPIDRMLKQMQAPK